MERAVVTPSEGDSRLHTDVSCGVLRVLQRHLAPRETPIQALLEEELWRLPSLATQIHLPVLSDLPRLGMAGRCQPPGFPPVGRWQ